MTHQQLNKTMPQDKNIKLHNDLINLVQKQQFNKIKKIYQKNKNKEKLNSNIWNIFAEANSHLGEYPEVAHCCKKLVAMDPSNYQAIYNYALAVQHLNNFNEAINAYEQCIKINSQYFNAYANCAALYQITGQHEKAIQYFTHALKLEDNTEVKIQLAKTYFESGNTNAAINTYNQILAKNQENDKARFFLAQLYYEIEDYNKSESHYLHLYQKNKLDISVINNLGRLYEQANNLDKAIDFYSKALELNNKLAITQRNLARLFLKKFKTTDQKEYIDKTVHTLNKAIEIEPGHPEPFFELGKIYNLLKDTDKAIEYFNQALNMDIPEDFKNAEEFRLAAKYFLSSVNNPDNYDKDKKDFIADLFDDYADKFDKHLVEGLEYKTPVLISEKISSLLSTDNKLNIIDLGCGTGLCAPFLSKYSKNLTGIDLSAKMIEKAKALNIYDNLIVGEITEELLSLNHSYNLVVAADVFVYIGGLSDIFSASYKKMETNGLFIFSTELHNDEKEEYRLFDSGRYKHSISYLNNLAEKYNFEIICNEECTLRKEHGIPVIGTLSVLKKTINT